MACRRERAGAPFVHAARRVAVQKASGVALIPAEAPATILFGAPAPIASLASG